MVRIMMIANTCEQICIVNGENMKSHVEYAERILGEEA